MAETTEAPKTETPAAPAAPVVPAAPVAPPVVPVAPVVAPVVAPAATAPVAPVVAPAASILGEAKPVVASDIELKLPEGFDAKAPVLGEFKALAKELGLDSAKSQKAFDLFVKAGGDNGAKLISEVKAQNEAWAAEVKADKTIGGDKLDASIKTAVRALNKFEGGQALHQVLNDTGLANHPAVVRFLVAVGKGLTEDTTAGANGAPRNGALTQEQKLRAQYPSMFKE